MKIWGRVSKNDLNPLDELRESHMRVEFRLTAKGLSSRIYEKQKHSSKKRGHAPPNYTLAAFRDWLYNHDSFVALYNNWFDSGFKTELIPSVDRLDDEKGYSFDNIRLVTWRENNIKRNKGHY